MKKTLQIFLPLIALLISPKALSQVTASFYTSGTLSKVAIGYNFNERLWADARIYSSTSADGITPEAVINYNYLAKESYYTYIGVGAIVNDVNGVLIPIGVGIKPFENLKNLSINIELDPLYEIDDEDLYINGFIGLRYKF
ncbi:hypothetical protein ACLI1A_08935 [Flavobacterium sp. RHBU_3]|uniref:hypothetical protein n=1 Tax=Flavobacterium sp. RHBU_3 TaxID=3391184 RepID=UPI0039846E9A